MTTSAKKTSAMIYTLTVNHRDGSRKQKIHAIFKKGGREAAMTAGLKAKLKKTTLRSWCSTWASDKYIKADKRAKKAA